MSFQSAALALSWIAIIVLAFGMAGTLALVRRLEATVNRAMANGSAGSPVFGGRPGYAAAAARFRPRGRRYAFVMTVSPDCPACAETMPEFRKLASGQSDVVDFRILAAAPLGPSTVETSADGAAVPIVVDAGAYAELAPGYSPGMIVIDAAGQVVEAGPGGDLAAVERWIGRHLRPQTKGAQA